MSDDGFLAFFVGLIVAALICLVVSVVVHAKNVEHRSDTRYELCLKKNMQWIDDNCISAK